AAESCNGSSFLCPADGVAASGVECRASNGVCDLAETCNGLAAGCPTDAKSTAVCRSPVDGCDATESCDGSADACPADETSAAGTTCRAASGICDVREECD